MKTKDEVDLEKEPDEFTRHPAINPEGAHLVNSNDVNLADIKGLDHKLY